MKYVNLTADAGTAILDLMTTTNAKHLTIIRESLFHAVGANSLVGGCLIWVSRDTKLTLSSKLDLAHCVETRSLAHWLVIVPDIEDQEIAPLLNSQHNGVLPMEWFEVLSWDDQSICFLQDVLSALS